jgi:hypothetical protein
MLSMSASTNKRMPASLLNTARVAVSLQRLLRSLRKTPILAWTLTITSLNLTSLRMLTSSMLKSPLASMSLQLPVLLASELRRNLLTTESLRRSSSLSPPPSRNRRIAPLSLQANSSRRLLLVLRKSVMDPASSKVPPLRDSISATILDRISTCVSSSISILS